MGGSEQRQESLPSARRADDAARPEAVVAAASGAVVLLALAALCTVLAVSSGRTVETIAATAGAWIGLLTGLMLLLAAYRGAGEKSVVLAADAIALVVVGGLLASREGTDTALLVVALFPVIHAATFQPAPAALALTAAGIAIAIAAVLVADGRLSEDLVLLVPAMAASGMVSLAVDGLRRERGRYAEQAAEARRLADQDGLTGVGNYRVFWRSLEAEGARARRHGDPFSLVLIDLDDFKQVNDEFGHLVGDDALRTVATALRGALRAEDRLCRQGGDEFGVIAVAAGRSEVEQVATRLVDAVAGADAGRAVPWQLTASTGCATWGQPATTPDDLVRQAETALREAKDTRARAEGRRSLGVMRSAGASPLRGRPSEPAAGRAPARLAFLTNLARALAAATTERAVVETAVAHAAGAVDHDAVGIVRGDGASPSLQLVAVSGRGATRARPGDAVPNRPPLTIALHERRPAEASATDGSGSTLARLLTDASGGPGGTGARAQLAAPILAGGELRGALVFESDRPNAYGPDDVALAEGAATAVGNALAVVALLRQLSSSGWRTEDDWTLAGERADEHGRMVARLATQVGRRLGLAAEEVRQLHLAALFHEIGTVCAPPGVVEKRGQLTNDEFAALREHPVVGERLLGSLPALTTAAQIVRAERERFDGMGYPDGLVSQEIPLAARILHACDAYVAMTTARPYRPSLAGPVAVEELRRNAGAQFDPDVVAAVVALVEGAEAGVG